MAASAEPGFNVSDPCPAVATWLAQFNQLNLADKTSLFVQVLAVAIVKADQPDQENIGISPSSARTRMVAGLVDKVAEMSVRQRQQVLQELIGNANTAIARAYGLFKPHTKLAFWQVLVNSTSFLLLVQVDNQNQAPETQPRQSLQANLAKLLPQQKLALLMAIATNMGVDPLAI
jgi:hypothetical protein